MQIKTFTINRASAEHSELEINLFLRSHRILRVEHHFIENDGGTWAVLIEYQDEQPDAVSPVAKRRNRKDVTEGMSEELRLRYENLRHIRSELATQRSVPAYVIFTNEELALLACEPVLNEETVKHIKGIAPSRIKDSISYFFDEVKSETNGTLDREDS